MKVRAVVAAVLIVVGILLCVGTIGSLELSEIGYFEAIVHSVIGFLFLSVGVFVGKDTDEKEV